MRLHRINPQKLIELKESDENQKSDGNKVNCKSIDELILAHKNNMKLMNNEENEVINIGRDIKIKVIKIGRRIVRIAVDAPQKYEVSQEGPERELIPETKRLDLSVFFPKEDEQTLDKAA